MDEIGDGIAHMRIVNFMTRIEGYVALSTALDYLTKNEFNVVHALNAFHKNNTTYKSVDKNVLLISYNREEDKYEYLDKLVSVLKDTA